MPRPADVQVYKNTFQTGPDVILDMPCSMYRDYFAEWVENEKQDLAGCLGQLVLDAMHDKTKWATLPDWMRDAVMKGMARHEETFDTWLIGRLDEEARNR